MKRSTYLVRRIASTSLLGAAVTLAAATVANAEPVPGDFGGVPSRTELSFTYTPTGVSVETANAHESRTGLSTVKLYVVDYVLRSGDGSTAERDLAERMIRASDDSAASTLDARYPQAIDATAARFGLADTRRGSFWGDSFTSASDTVEFLEATKRENPASPILAWMAAADPVAADGTVQDWGTGRLAGVVGTKWGWADDASTDVASASFGDDFSVAAQTYGDAADQTADVLGALGRFDLQRPPTVVPVVPPSPFDALVALLPSS